MQTESVAEKHKNEFAFLKWFR